MHGWINQETLLEFRISDAQSGHTVYIFKTMKLCKLCLYTVCRRPWRNRFLVDERHTRAMGIMIVHMFYREFYVKIIHSRWSDTYFLSLWVRKWIMYMRVRVFDVAAATVADNTTAVAVSAQLSAPAAVVTARESSQVTHSTFYFIKNYSIPIPMYNFVQCCRNFIPLSSFFLFSPSSFPFFLFPYSFRIASPPPPPFPPAL